MRVLNAHGAYTACVNVHGSAREVTKARFSEDSKGLREKDLKVRFWRPRVYETVTAS